jgi:predicted HAD superfamily phosphohydrolase YqeG
LPDDLAIKTCHQGLTGACVALDDACVALNDASVTATKRRLADTLLDSGLSAYVSSRRKAQKSWRQISLDIREDVNLDIHPETLRLWFVEPAQRVAS